MDREAQITELERAIAALEAQRNVLGEAVVQAALEPLKEKLASLASAHGGPDQQLKYVTVLFTDIVGSTKMGQQLDPEDTLAIMEGALTRFKGVIEKHGGEVTRFMGDGLKAIFGMPAAHEDDAERAVRAGLELLEESSQYAQHVKTEWGLSGFTIRVGINTGQVILGGGVEADHSAAGMAINLAARMESAAPAGGLLISQNTYRHVRGLFEVDAQPLITVKGSDADLQTYCVRKVIPHSFRDTRRGVAGIAPPIFGRQSEMGKLIACYEESVSGKGAQVVSIVGEPGVGKSRLIFEFERWSQKYLERITLFKGRATEQLAGTPYALLREVITDHFRIQPHNSAQDMIQLMVRRMSPYLGDQAEMKTHFIAGLIGIQSLGSPYLRVVNEDPQQLRERALYYLQQYFSALQDELPVVIFLDDLQWADPPSLEAFLVIAGECRSCRLFVVCAARPVFLEKRRNWAEQVEARHVTHHLIRLRRLSQDVSRALVDEILSRVDGPANELRELVVSKADGNPYYIEELVKMLIEEGVIAIGDDSKWKVDAAALDMLQVPPTLTAVLQARLDGLPPAEKVTLQRASVIGRVFWDAALGALDDQGRIPVIELDSLSQRELVVPGGKSAFLESIEYQLKHDIMRSVTYSTVLKNHRKRCHARAAAWLAASSIANGQADVYAAVIAGHFKLADDSANAAVWYLRAGENALARGAPEQALQFYQAALDLLSPEDLDQRWRGLYGRTLAISRLADMASEGLACSQDLAALAQEMDDAYKLAEALYHQAYFQGIIGQGEVELEALENALRAARDAHHQVAESHILGIMVASLVKRGDLTAAEKFVEETLAFAQSTNDQNLLARALINISLYYTQTGDISRAVQLTSQQAEILHQLGDARGEAYSLENLGYQYIFLGTPEQGVEVFKRVERLAALIGDRRLELYNQLNLALACLRSNDFLRAESILEDIIASAKAEEEFFARASSYSYLGMALEGSAAWARAIECYHFAATMFQQVDARGYCCDALAGEARSHLALGDMPAAIMKVKETWGYLQEHGPSGLEFPLRAYLTCVEVFRSAGERELSEAALRVGYHELVQRTGKISDPKQRKVYLNDIPEHRALLDQRRNEL